MAFAPQFLDEIRARLPLAEVIGRQVRLSRRGHEYVALCPFHNEKTPSFTVSEDKGFFHCFGCGAHGDVIGFVMRVENLGFPEAVERLAAQAGLEVPVPSRDERERAKERLSLYAVTEAAAAWFETQLSGTAGAVARKYLARRGLDEATIRKFRLGFAPESRSALREALGQQGISEEMMVVAGLLIQPEDGGEPYDRFRNRVIFPIADRRGRAVGFGGRALGEGVPKYLNSPESPLFHKGVLLYGLPLAAESVRKEESVVAVEGYMDVIALHRVGLANAVAPLGTALTEFQIEELWRLAGEPIVCFDGDEAGERAAFRAAERALSRLRPGKSLRFAFLPEGEDPDSLVVNGGPARMREVLQGARPLAEVLWSRATSEFGMATPERQAAALRRLTELVGRIPDRDLRYYYVRHYRNRMWSALREARPSPSPSGRPLRGSQGSERLVRRRQGSAADRERALLQTLLNFPPLVSEFLEETARIELESPRYRRLRDAMIATVSRGEVGADDLRRYLAEEAGFRELVGSLVGERARYLDWASREGEASIQDARTQLRHMLNLHHRLVELERFKHEAEKAFAAEPSEQNSERLINAIRLLQQAPGFEAEIPEYGRASGREPA